MVKHIIIFGLRCKIIVIHFHSLTEGWDLVDEGYSWLINICIKAALKHVMDGLRQTAKGGLINVLNTVSETEAVPVSQRH